MKIIAKKEILLCPKIEAMRQRIITVIALLALSLGTAAMRETKAQMYMYYDPFELSEPEVEEEEVAYFEPSSVNYTAMIWVGVAVWALLAGVLLRYIRIHKSKHRRNQVENMRKWYYGRAAAMMGLILLFTLPAQAQVFENEETRERVQMSNLPDVNYKEPKAKGGDRGMYAPLGGEVLLLSLLGGAYLVGKRGKKEE